MSTKKQLLKTWSTAVKNDEARQKIACALCGEKVFRPALACKGFAFVRCKKCGLVQQNPQPLPKEVSDRYQAQDKKSYLDYELENEASFLRLQVLALEDINFYSIERELKSQNGKAPLHAVDIGSATGALLSWLQFRGWEVLGIELSAEMAEWAQRERGLDVRALRLEEAKLKDASFDLVHASHLIEHLNDPRAFVQEVKRILRPGGWFILSTPAIDGLQARLFGSRWRSAIWDHLYLFSRKSLRALLESEGFIIKRKKSWGGLGLGTAPRWLKAPIDRLAKRWDFGDVIIYAAQRKN